VVILAIVAPMSLSPHSNKEISMPLANLKDVIRSLLISTPVSFLGNPRRPVYPGVLSWFSSVSSYCHDLGVTIDRAWIGEWIN
jgi:hypothetical protein